MTPVRLEPAAPRSRVKRSTTEPLRSLAELVVKRSYNGPKSHKNQHDITITVEICNVSSKTSTLKFSLDQKASQILNNN